MSRREIPYHEAAIAAEMMENGYSGNETSRVTGISRGSLHNIAHRDHHWARTCELPIFKQWRQEAKQEIQGRANELAVKLLAHAEKCVTENPEKTSPYQAVGMYGILRTHDRLDAGEPTEITLSASIQVVETLETVADKLAQVALLRHKKRSEVG